MMKTGMILVLVLGTFLMGQVAFSEVPFLGFKPGAEPEGFRGVSLGSDLSTLGRMKHQRTDSSHGGIEFYTTDTDALVLGRAKLESIEYGFWKGKLYVVMINTKDLANWNSLKETVFGQYGPGAQAFKEVESYIWEGENVAMALWYNETSKTGIFYMRSIPMKRQMDAVER
jgi:hypothetical protein